MKNEESDTLKIKNLIAFKKLCYSSFFILHSSFSKDFL